MELFDSYQTKEECNIIVKYLSHLLFSHKYTRVCGFIILYYIYIEWEKTGIFNNKIRYYLS